MEVKMLREYKVTQVDLDGSFAGEYFSGDQLYGSFVAEYFSEDQEVTITFNNGNFVDLSLNNLESLVKNLDGLSLLYEEIKKRSD